MNVSQFGPNDCIYCINVIKLNAGTLDTRHTVGRVFQVLRPLQNISDLSSIYFVKGTRNLIRVL